MQPLEVVIPGAPQAQERGRIRRFGRPCVSCKQPRHSGIYDPPKSAAWKKHAAAHMLVSRKRAGLPVFDGAPLKLEVLAVFPCPKASHRVHKPAEREWKTVKNGDASNVLKAIEDAGNNGVLWTDDSLVAWPTIRCITAAQGEEPAVYLRVSVLDVDDVPTSFAARPEVSHSPHQPLGAGRVAGSKA